MTTSIQSKALRGTLKPSRLRSARGLPLVEVLPNAPPELPEAARKAWREIGERAVSLRVLTDYDLPLLAIAARSIGAVEELEAAVQRDGVILESGSGARKAHPAVAAAATARALAVKCLGELGLSAPGREKISLTPPPQDGN